MAQVTVLAVENQGVLLPMILLKSPSELKM